SPALSPTSVTKVSPMPRPPTAIFSRSWAGASCATVSASSNSVIPPPKFPALKCFLPSSISSRRSIIILQSCSAVPASSRRISAMASSRHGESSRHVDGLDLARNIKLHPLHQHLAIGGQANHVDRSGIFGRARVVSRHGPIADLHGAVPMAERHIVSAGGGDFVVIDQPGRTRHYAAIDTRIVVTVTRCNLPARAARSHRLERHHVAVVEMGAAPNLQTQVRQIDRFGMSDAEHYQVVERG